MKLSNFLALHHAKDIAAIANPILKKFDFNYFQYLTVYKDGSTSFTCNNSQYVEFVLNYALTQRNKQLVFSQPPQGEKLNDSRYYFLWETSLPREPIQMANEFGIYNGMTFVERFEDRYNMVAFASPHSAPVAVNTYLNHLDELEKFIRHFEYNHQNLITDITSQTLALTTAQKDNHIDAVLLKQRDKRIAVTFAQRQSYVTPREYHTLKLLAKGHTYKSIAILLNISPRTVESYINRIKGKFDIHQKSELIALADVLH